MSTSGSSPKESRAERAGIFTTQYFSSWHHLNCISPKLYFCPECSHLNFIFYFFVILNLGSSHSNDNLTSLGFATTTFPCLSATTRCSLTIDSHQQALRLPWGLLLLIINTNIITIWDRGRKTSSKGGGGIRGVALFCSEFSQWLHLQSQKHVPSKNGWFCLLCVNSKCCIGVYGRESFTHCTLACSYGGQGSNCKPLSLQLLPLHILSRQKRVKEGAPVLYS